MPLLGEASIDPNYDKQLIVHLKGQNAPVIFYHYTEDFFNQNLAAIQQAQDKEYKEKLKGIKNLNLQEIFLSFTQGQDIEIPYPFMVGTTVNNVEFYFYYFISYNNIDSIGLAKSENEGGDVL